MLTAQLLLAHIVSCHVEILLARSDQLHGEISNADEIHPSVSDFTDGTSTDNYHENWFDFLQKGRWNCPIGLSMGPTGTPLSME